MHSNIVNFKLFYLLELQAHLHIKQQQKKRFYTLFKANLKNKATAEPIVLLFFLFTPTYISTRKCKVSGSAFCFCLTEETVTSFPEKNESKFFPPQKNESSKSIAGR